MAKNQPGKSKTRDWVIRIVIFGVLGVVLVLAFLDYQQKQQATQTGTAWRALLNEANDTEDELPLEKLTASMKGSPEVIENEGNNVYTWKGQFRSYVITVNYDRGANKPVSDIEGP